MKNLITIGLPSKGRLKEGSVNYLRKNNLELSSNGAERNYFAEVKNFPFIKIISKVFNMQYIENLHLHKFSMVDIFLLSFIVFAGKTSNYFEIHLLIGFYFLLTSVLINYSYIILYKFLNNFSKT